MRIHDLKIDNVRALEHVELTDLPETGVILIHGDNEAGKSTILDALDAVLTAKHDSTAAKIRALAPKGRDETPEVTLTATIGPYTFTIFKRFGGRSKGKAELTITAPVREQFSGEEAHNKLGEIISAHLDQELFNALFLRQGSFAEGIAAAGIPTFTRALEESGGSADAALDDSGLMERVEQEYQRYFTPKGGDNKTLKEADQAVADAEDAVRAAAEQKASYDAHVDEYARCTAELASIDAELPGALAERDEREQEAAAVRELAQKLEGAQDRAERAATDAARAGADIEARRALAERLELLEREAAAITDELEPAQRKAAEEEAALAARQSEYEEASAGVNAARQAVADAERSLEAARGQERLAELRDIVERLDEVEAEIARLVKAQPERPVTDADVRAFEQAAGEVELQRRLADAAAARVDIVADAAATISVDGAEIPVDAEESIALHDGTVIALPGFTLTYRAAPGTDTARSSLAEAESDLARLRDALGCATAEEAREMRDEHRELAASLESARARREDILRGNEADELREELARLSAAVASDDSATSTAAPATVDDATAALADARANETAARDAAHELEVVLATLRQRPQATKLADLEARIANQRRTAELARAELEAARTSTADDALDAAYQAAEAAHAEAVEAANALAAEVAGADPEMAESRLAGARNRVANLESRYRKNNDTRLQLQYRVHAAEGEAENLDRAEAALEVARVRRDGLRRRAEAVKLLRETLIAHRDAARAKYAEPFAAALQKYASRVFGPGTEFTLDDSLSVTARTLGGTTVDLDQLSGGAKEQMGLLTRFAIADLVARSDAESMPVPVIVDDALGATDPTRLELMNALFSQVGESSQVFVLTCFPQRFDRVAAARTASMPELAGRMTLK